MTSWIAITLAHMKALQKTVLQNIRESATVIHSSSLLNERESLWLILKDEKDPPNVNFWHRMPCRMLVLEVDRVLPDMTARELLQVAHWDLFSFLARVLCGTDFHDMAAALQAS